MIVERQPRPDWSAVPRPGVVGVQARVLLHREGLLVVQLHFAPEATIDPHGAPHEIDVLCVSGSGRVSVGEEESTLQAGQRVVWPAAVEHCLWTEEFELEVIVVERVGRRA